MPSSLSTVSAEAVLRRLQNKHPSGAWSVDVKGYTLTKSVNGVRLLRRNVPLTDEYFMDVHFDGATNSIVGIRPGSTPNNASGQVLVDYNSGNPVKRQVITIKSWDGVKATFATQPPPSANPAAAATSSLSSTSTSASTPRSEPRSSSNNNNNTTSSLTDEQNQELLKYGGMIFGGILVLRLLATAFFGLYLIAIPFVYFYLLQNCPSVQSFDAKKELKRVLRGHHLSDDHPDKPKGFFHETIARISASLTTELATGLGYEQTMVPLAGAAMVAVVNVPSVKMEFYWIGAAGKWWYIFSRKTESEDE